MVYRNDLSGDPAFHELLKRTRKHALDASTHQDFPFERLVDELGVTRSLGHTPVFQVMFLLQDTLTNHLQFPGLEVEMRPMEPTHARFDLTLSLEKDREGYKGGILYSVALFHETTIARLAKHFRNLLESVVEDPWRRLSLLELMGKEETRQILSVWNRTKQDFEEVPLHALFENRTRAQPDALALVAPADVSRETRWVTYEALEEKANRLAERLARYGVGNGQRVALLFDPCAEIVLSALAVLKRGAAYVPVDPASPRERLSEILSQADISLVLNREMLNAGPHGAWMDKNPGRKPDRTAIPARRGSLKGRTSLEMDAYIVFTSGTTGKPKGVAVSHGAIVNYTRALLELGGGRDGMGDHFAMVTPLFTDLCLSVMYPALASGATLHLLSSPQVRDAAAFARYFHHHRIDCLKIVPSHLSALMEVSYPERVFPRKLLILGGEASSCSLVKKIQAKVPCTIINHYGPSEATVGMLTYRLSGQPESGSTENLPLGRPIANTQAFILDSRLFPLPLGSAGELVIGGVGLARGYLQRADRTAERFVPDPYSGIAGGRLYRTGDMARQIPTKNGTPGAAEFLGRTDHQIKWRGYRIEPGEIESALRGQEGIADAVADFRAGRLLAYLKPAKPGTDSSSLICRVQNGLEDKLPTYMIPSQFLVLDEFPLTGSGKIDRGRLPDQDPDHAGRYLPPRTKTEIQLSAVWRKILKKETIGIRDNFFELGGHSLLATRVLARTQKLLGVELGLHDLFRHPTVEGLARTIDSLPGQTMDATAAVFSKTPAGQPPTLSHAQRRLWLLDRLEGPNTTYNLAYGLQLHGFLDCSSLENAFHFLFKRHESFGATFPETDGGPSLKIAPISGFALPIVDVSGLKTSESSLQKSMGEMADQPFSLGTGPLFRMVLLRLGAHLHQTYLTMHHIISDGWSMGILVRDLASIYETLVYQRPYSKPVPKFQYHDYAYWQQNRLTSEMLSHHQKYWKGRLAGAPAFISLPMDRPRPPVQSFRGNRELIQLDPNLAGGIRALATRSEATLFMVLHTAFAVLLGSYSGQKDVVIGAPTANRPNRESETLMGFFRKHAAVENESLR